MHVKAPLKQSGNPSTALYTPEERMRRDATPWTLVQGILAPVQFLVFLVSVGLVCRFLATGEGQGAATISIVAKTFVLYTIMVTGAIWEKVVFSMLVIALHTAYLYALVTDALSIKGQMILALAAYATYVINAGQFLWKLRMARLQARLQTNPVIGQEVAA